MNRDALGRRLEPLLPVPRDRDCGGDDGLWSHSCSRHAGGCVPRVRASVRRGPNRGAGHVHRGDRIADHDSARAVAQQHSGSGRDAVEVGAGALRDYPDLQARNRQFGSPPVGQRAARDRDAEHSDVGRHTLDSAAPLGNQPGDEDRSLVLEVLDDRPVDDRLLDDPVAVDGGPGGCQRRDLGRPFQAASVPGRPGQAEAARRHAG